MTEPGRESVGYLDREGKFVALENRSPTPACDFRLRTADSYAVRGEGEVFYHSHPPGFAWPSEADQVGVMDAPRAWCIAADGEAPFFFGDGVPLPPLLERPYRYGQADCYTLVRDGLVQFDVALKRYPSAWAWWKNGQALFDENLESEGFRCLPAGTRPEPGDLYLFAIRSAVSNHLALYLGAGEIIHHPSSGKPVDLTYLSRPDLLGRYLTAGFPHHHVRHATRD